MSEPRSEYGLCVRSKSVKLGSRADIATGHSFATTLSEADKRTLAFAFFVARLRAAANLAAKLVVLDDPVSSLDRNRRHQSIRLIANLANDCKQLLVLSHDAYFVRELRERLSDRKRRGVKQVVSNLETVELGNFECQICVVRSRLFDQKRALIPSPYLRRHGRKTRSSKCPDRTTPPKPQGVNLIAILKINALTAATAQPQSRFLVFCGMFAFPIDTTYTLCRTVAVIPDFESSGLLPAGIHWATWGEVVARFGWNKHRMRLLSGLKRALLALELAGCKALFLDGSFVTSKANPSDYDACWVFAEVQASKLDPVFLDFTNKRAAQRIKYGGEFFLAYSAAEGPPLYRKYINFLQVDKDTETPKGIIGINLTSL